MGVERVVLEDHGDVSLARLLRGDVLSGEVNGARCGRIQAGYEAQEGGFSAARGADEGNEGSFRHGKVGGVEDGAMAIGFAQAADLEKGIVLGSHCASFLSRVE